MNKMNKIKHIVSIRFCTWDIHNTGLIFDKNFLLSRFNLLKTHSIRSLENQNNKNFDVCIIINKNHTINDISFLYDLQKSSPLNISIIKSNEIKTYFTSFISKYDYIISTNIDDDDLCDKDCIDIIQNSIKENTTFKMFGFVNCATLDDDTKNAYLFTKDYLGKTGFLTIMSSIIYRTNINMSQKFPYIVNSVADNYNGDHPHWKNIIESEYKNWGLEKLDDDYFDYDKSDNKIRIIWVRHKYTTSIDKHSSNIKVNNINFNDFGYTINE